MPDADQRLSGKRALVTGASSGIGRAIVLRLAAAGARVAACGRDAVRTADVARIAGERTGEAVPLIGDVSVDQDCERLVNDAVSALGGLDIVVNGAGIDMERWRPVHEIPVETWDDIIAVNLRGAFLVSRFAIPHLLDAGGGALVHVASIGAVTVWAGDCAYDVSKAGLAMLSNHIAVEYAKDGIRSNTLMPGIVETPLLARLAPEGVTRVAFKADLAERHPVGRLGRTDEIADAALFLCTAPGFLTGARIAIDGGYSCV